MPLAGLILTSNRGLRKDMRDDMKQGELRLRGCGFRPAPYACCRQTADRIDDVCKRWPKDVLVEMPIRDPLDLRIGHPRRQASHRLRAEVAAVRHLTAIDGGMRHSFVRQQNRTVLAGFRL